MEHAIAALVGLVIGFAISKMLAKGDDDRIQELERATDQAVEQARREAEERARAEAEAQRQAADEALAERRAKLKGRETTLREREKSLDSLDAQLAKRDGQLNRREKDINRRDKRVQGQEETLEGALEEQRGRLEQVAGLSQKEARDLLMAEVQDEAKRLSIDRIRAIESEARQLAEERARMVVSAAIQRYASEHVADRTVVSVDLPSEDMKGRIIGREGRNIRAFEAATGCDVIIDDTPDAVVISTFNPARREVGRMAMEKLLADGRIHPARIEEVVARTRKEMGQVIRHHGNAALLELEITGLNGELIKALGRLHFATTFAQNVLRHSVEVGALAGLIATELGLKPQVARRAGLLHDIGKAAEQDTEGSHAAAGAALLRKYGEKKEIIEAVAAHHDEALQTTLLSQIVATANTLSASRPGARRESLAATIKRLEDLETLAREFDGVETAFAVQAGREIRVMVDNARLSDRDADLLCRELARRIEKELSYPGEVKVSVVRSTRAIKYAR